MMKIDYYASVGYALELLAKSDYHRRFGLGDYVRVEILPALWSGQSRLYLTADGVPTAMVTWAWLSEEVERDVHATGRALRDHEWTCGDRLFCNDWITPYGNLREIAHDMAHNIFPDEIATSLRRNPDGSVRRINRWTGVNRRQSAAPVAANADARRVHAAGPQDAPPFRPLQDYPALLSLCAHWRMIRDEYRRLDLQTLPIRRDGKSHEQVFAEVQAHTRDSGHYGWLMGWGSQAQKWTQLGLVMQDQDVPFLRTVMPETLRLLRATRGIKVAALLKMAPGTFLETHTHPELAEQGLLQFHLTLDAAETRNFAYLNVDGEFRQHVPGEAFVFDGARPHFAVNASDQDRIILYLEFDPSQMTTARPGHEDENTDCSAPSQPCAAI